MSDSLASTELIVVGVADLAIAAAATHRRLVTYALGSCIGLTAYDPIARIGGMLHYMLPQPSRRQVAFEDQPLVYATSGVALLFDRLCAAGARRERFVVCAAGASEIMTESRSLAIGRRNRTMLRKILWKDGVAVAGEDTGGSLARTMSLDLACGTVTVKTRHDSKAIWSPGAAAVGPTHGAR